jgi:hypothetical protein
VAANVLVAGFFRRGRIKGMRFSRSLAIAFGILVPIAETVRRWHTWREYPPAIFDDYIMCAFLLGSVLCLDRNVNRGRLVLAAAWGYTCGLGYASFFGHLKQYLHGEADPAPIPSGAVLAIKGIGFLLAIAALIATLAAKTDAERNSPSAH